MLTRLLIPLCLVVAWAQPALAAGNKKAASPTRSATHRPQAAQTGRAQLLVAGNLDAEPGIGLGLEYDLPIVSDAGPGRLLLAPSAALIVGSDENARRDGCDVTHRERVIAGAVSLRYVLDLHEKVRPWASAGLGAYSVRHQYTRNEPCPADVETTASYLDPGLLIGLGMDIDLSDAMLVSFGLVGHEAQDEFATLSIGLGWRF